MTTAQKKTVGGKRPGAGRKPLTEGESLDGGVLQVRVSTRQKVKAERLGGASWVRKKIDQAKDPE